MDLKNVRLNYVLKRKFFVYASFFKTKSRLFFFNSCNLSRGLNYNQASKKKIIIFNTLKKNYFKFIHQRWNLFSSFYQKHQKVKKPSIPKLLTKLSSLKSNLDNNIDSKNKKSQRFFEIKAFFQKNNLRPKVYFLLTSFVFKFPSFFQTYSKRILRSTCSKKNSELKNLKKKTYIKHNAFENSAPVFLKKSPLIIDMNLKDIDRNFLKNGENLKKTEYVNLENDEKSIVARHYYTLLPRPNSTPKELDRANSQNFLKKTEFVNFQNDEKSIVAQKFYASLPPPKNLPPHSLPSTNLPRSKRYIDLKSQGFFPSRPKKKRLQFSFIMGVGLFFCICAHGSPAYAMQNQKPPSATFASSATPVNAPESLTDQELSLGLGTTPLPTLPEESGSTSAPALMQSTPALPTLPEESGSASTSAQALVPLPAQTVLPAGEGASNSSSTPSTPSDSAGEGASNSSSTPSTPSDSAGEGASNSSSPFSTPENSDQAMYMIMKEFRNYAKVWAKERALEAIPLPEDTPELKRKLAERHAEELAFVNSIGDDLKRIAEKRSKRA